MRYLMMTLALAAVALLIVAPVATAYAERHGGVYWGGHRGHGGFRIYVTPRQPYIYRYDWPRYYDPYYPRSYPYPYQYYTYPMPYWTPQPGLQFYFGF